jgi:exopolysaccharide production protein ExoZ
MQTSSPTDEGRALRDPHPAGKATIFGLQGLRFIAAAMVVVTHVLNREVTLYHPFPLPRAPWMEAGVDIFFVISGFIMVYIMRPDTRPGAFWLQRFTRIAPLYWVATAVAFIGGLVLPAWFFGRQGWLFGLESALFMPVGGDSWAHPLISPGWTLIYEFAFYSLLTLCLIVRRPPFVLATAAIGVVVGLYLFGIKTLPWLNFYGDEALMLEFVYGMMAAWLLGRQRLLKPWHGLVLGLAGLVLIYFLFDLPTGGVHWPRGIKVGLPAFLTVFGFLVSEPIWRRYTSLQQFARLGDASYSIYIIHFFFVSAIATWFGVSAAVRDGLGPYGFTAFSVAVGLGSGMLAHIFIEKPLLHLARSWLPRRAPRPAEAVPESLRHVRQAELAAPGRRG